MHENHVADGYSAEEIADTLEAVRHCMELIRQAIVAAIEPVFGAWDTWYAQLPDDVKAELQRLAEESDGKEC